jgi:hypothetical protein
MIVADATGADSATPRGAITRPIHAPPDTGVRRIGEVRLFVTDFNSPGAELRDPPSRS